MVENTDQIKADIDQRRAGISDKADKIDNRVLPSRAMSRRQSGIRRRLTGLKDSVFGNEESDYDSYSEKGFKDAGITRNPVPSTPLDSQHSASGSAIGSALGQASDADDLMHHAPQELRKKTRGNPMAAGLLALAGGWLAGSLLPESRRENRLARKLEPEVTQAASALKVEGIGLARELTEPAKEAAADVTQSGRAAAKSVLDQNAPQ